MVFAFMVMIVRICGLPRRESSWRPHSDCLLRFVRSYSVAGRTLT